MALQFIFGGSGSGKSTYLYNKITNEAEKHPDLNYMVLVPEQFTMQTQKDLVFMSRKHGIMNIDVLSFVRLSHRIFEETGKGQIPILDDEGKNLVLRKIAGDSSLELCMLKGNIKKLGYISEVKSVISEFTQYDIGIEELERVMESVGTESSLYYKLKDMALLYERFQKYLQNKYITKEELLDVLCRVAEESELLKKSTVVLDGFTGFTPVQNRLLEKLLKICRDVIITVTIDERENPYAYKHPYQLFAMSKHTVSTLMDIAKLANVEVKEPVCLKQRPFFRFRKAPGLEFLEKSLFRSFREDYGTEPEEIEIHTARDPGREALAAVGEIRRLIRKKQYRYREVGVIVTDMEAYGDYLEQAFRAYDIPVFMDKKRNILLNSFVEYIRSLLAMIEQNFTYDSVFRFLRTGYAPFTNEEIDALENYVVGIGVKGYKRWQERFVRRTKGMKEEELERLNHLRVVFVEKIDGLAYVLRQRSKTVEDITTALYEFIAGEKMQEVLKLQEEKFQERGELALAREYAQVYGIVMDLFDKFVGLLGDEKVSLEEYEKLLDAGLAEAKVGVIPPGLDQVLVGDMERTRLKDVKALFFLGANDTYLPGALMRTGLLTERDREQFEKEKLHLTPGGREQAYVQKFYLYLNLTKPSERLYIYYSKMSADGKSIRPSYLVQEMCSLYPGLKIVEEEEKTLREREMTERTAAADLIDGLRMKSETAGSAWLELYNWYKSRQEWADKLAALLEAAFYRRPKDAISQRAARTLYGEHFEDSITRMEKFSACAFAHFLTYGLRLRERQEYEFQALDMGNIFHSAIERYSKKVQASGRGWTGLAKKEQEQLVAESVEEAVAGYGNSVLYSSARNEYMIIRMTKMLNRTVWALTRQLEQGDFVPESYELRFGNGKIDRVDTCVDKDEVYVKIVDYKTGMTAFDISALYYGLQLQLMVYMDAAVELTRKKYPQKEVIPSGVFYYRIQDPLVDKTRDRKELDERLLRELRPDGIVSLEKNSLLHLDHSFEGESLAAPIKFNKNKSLAKASKTVSGEEFRTMTEYAGRKVAGLHERILIGEVDVKPWRQGKKTGCDYCPYKHVCGFDETIPGYNYRDIEKLGKEEALAKMKAQKGEDQE